jgi:competence transcription factor ComK
VTFIEVDGYWVNPSHICAFRVSRDDTSVWVTLVTGDHLTLHVSLDEFKRALFGAGPL